MKKVLQWIGITLGAFAGYLLVRYGLPLILVVGLLTGLSVKDEALNNTAEEALDKLGLTPIVRPVTTNDLSIHGVMTSFPIYRYDSGDNDIHEALMTHLAAAEDWHIGALTADAFAEQLTSLHPDAAFLLPAAETTFDAWYTTPTTFACFDRNSYLFICIEKSATPIPGEISMDSFTVPHNGYLYELETHAGFFGDGTTHQAFIVPEDDRPALETTLAAHTDWHAGKITQREYAHLHAHNFGGVPGLYPAEDITFDWWCYVNTYAREHPDHEPTYIPDNSSFPAAMREAGARPSGNWLCALYDPDTGLFIFYQSDS